MESRFNPASSLRLLLQSTDALWRRRTRPGGQVWTHNVDERLGSLICVWFVRTRITPNAVTLLGLVVHLVVAGYVMTLTAPVSGISVAIVLAGWQLAFALDCTDGQLARERGVASPFGAWLDQLADYIAHVAVYLSLGLFLVRSLQLEPATSAVLVCVISAANVFQLFASAERNVLMGTGGGIHLETKGWVRALGAVRHLSDYGAILLIASVLLLFPKGLLVFVIATGVLAVGTVVGQVGYNWARITGSGHE